MCLDIDKIVESNRINSEKLKVFSIGGIEDDAENLAHLSRGQSKKEILECYCITDIKDLSPEDVKLLDLMFMKGRATARAEVVDTLFKDMKPDVALAYLKMFGEEWKGDDTGLDGNVIEGIRLMPIAESN